MKRNSIMIFIAVVVLCLAGCGERPQDTAAFSDTDIKNENADQEGGSVVYFGSSEDEKYDSFVFHYQDGYTPLYLEECQCEYDRDGIRVYSKQMSGYDEWMDFPHDQYLLYIRTPFVWQQIFPVKDFKLNEETGTIYLLREKEEFESLQKLELHNESRPLEKELLIGYSSMEQMIIDAYGLSQNSELGERNVKPHMSELHFEFGDSGKPGHTWKIPSEIQEIHKSSALKGRVSGIEKNLDKIFYLNFEWDDLAGKEIVSPCVFRMYDPQADAVDFKKCREAFGRIMQGDWSDVEPIEGLDYMWGMDGEEWRQADVNGDGLPELISQGGNGCRTEYKKPIDLIFAWNGENAELVYIDLTDAAEFLFMTDEDQLISEWSTTGTPKRSQYTQYHFDERWNLTFEQALSILYFADGEGLEEYESDLPKNFGRGMYYLYQYGSNYSPASRQIGYYEFMESYQKMTGQDFLDDNNRAFWEEELQEEFTGEDLFDYEIRTDDRGDKYAVINGFREEHQNDFADKMYRMTVNKWVMSFPKRLEGAVVKELAAYAFQNVSLNEIYDSVRLSANITTVGEHCFENCGLTDVEFEKAAEGKEFETLTVCDGAFAKNPELWGIYFNDRETVFGEGVFEECAEKVYLCYRKGAEEKAGYFKKYALENHLNAAEIPACYSETPLVDYPETPLVLTPEVRNFFYGENAWSDDEDIFCSFEYDDNAPDYGFPEWHIPCGEFCAMAIGPYDGITASSELASVDGRYAPEHLSSCYGRDHAWAEGVEGNGIGESISIVSCCSYQYYQHQEASHSDRDVIFLEGDIEPDIYDGYMRYTEICVVNGYAKNQTVWEENGRVKRLLMYVEDKPYAWLELEDTIYPQYFTLPFDAIKAADGVDIHFQFVIEDVYPGTKYEDTCLTGLVVEFMGRRGH